MSAVGSRVVLTDLTVAYERHPAVHHITGCFEPGSATAIVGPNGAGKTTLLKAIAGLLRPASGRIDRDVASSKLAYLAQQSEIERDFPITVADAVLLGFWRRLGWHREATRADLDAASAALDAVGLDRFERRTVATLSTGQFQRMLFARLMLQDAPLILLDEPFTALDTATIADLLTIVARWHGEGRTVIAVLHDLEQVRAVFLETLLLARKRIDWGPTADVLTPANLARARAMSETWDEDAEACAAEPALPA